MSRQSAGGQSQLPVVLTAGWMHHHPHLLLLRLLVMMQDAKNSTLLFLSHASHRSFCSRIPVSLSLPLIAPSASSSYLTLSQSVEQFAFGVVVSSRGRELDCQYVRACVFVSCHTALTGVRSHACRQGLSRRDISRDILSPLILQFCCPCPSSSLSTGSRILAHTVAVVRNASHSHVLQHVKSLWKSRGKARHEIRGRQISLPKRERARSRITHSRTNSVPAL